MIFREKLFEGIQYLNIEELNDESAPLGAYVFPKHSIYSEKVSRIIQFLAVEHIRKERKYKILPILPKISSQNLGSLTVFDLHKCFLYFMAMLVVAVVILLLELIIKKLK